jgi:SSS family solute:Na+ symporter
MAILFVLNILIMLIIGKIKPRKEPFQLEYTKQVDITPWKHTKIVGSLVVLIVVSIYIYFA